MITENHNDEKLAIALFDRRNWFGCLLFSVVLIRANRDNKIKWQHYLSQLMAQ